MQIFGPMLRGLREVLGLHEARHGVLLENLANVETPGYRARDLEFSDALKRAFEPDRAPGDATRDAQVVVDRTSPVKPDGNSVDVDLEMARLSDNAFRIVALSRIVARKYAGMKELLAEVR